jgi:hypothetical protein
LIDKGLQRVKEFSWERCARQTAKVFESMVSPLSAQQPGMESGVGSVKSQPG